MAGADDLRHRLGRLLADSDPDAAGRLIDQARAAAEDRVRSLLTDAYVDVLLARVREAAGAPSAVPQAAPPRAAPPPPGDGLGWYVYCVIDGDHDPVPNDLDGVAPGHPVTTLQAGELVAVVSRVPLSEFGEEPLRQHLSDLEWLERTARRHEEVQEEVAGGGTPIPMRLCSIYRDESGVREMLAREGAALREAINHLRGRAEWGIKAFADVDAGDAGGAPAADSQPAAATGDGAAYMQNRLHQRRRHQEAAAQLDTACDSLHAALCAVASDGVILAPHRPELTGRGTPMIFNASYLVSDADISAFEREVDRLTGELAPLGIELERTGPWPPYNFVPGTIGAAW